MLSQMIHSLTTSLSSRSRSVAYKDEEDSPLPEPSQKYKQK